MNGVGGMRISAATRSRVLQAADDLGSADLRADETAQPEHGLSTTTGTGARREDTRADWEGVNELAGSGPGGPDRAPHAPGRPRPGVRERLSSGQMTLRSRSGRLARTRS